MPRTHARILVSIWTDPDFRALSPEAQRTYLLLLSQGSLNNVGVLDMTVKRWAGGCHATTSADVEKSLAELDDRRFVLVDDDTEEVMIRSFIRNDGIAKQPQMLKNALKLAEGVESPRLRAELARELRRLGRADADATADQLDPNPTPGPGGGSPIQAHGSLTAGSDQPASSPAEGSDETVTHSDSAQPDGTLRSPRRGRGRGSSSSSVRSTSVSGAAKRGTRLPDDFVVTPEMVEWARRECPHIDGRHETAKFTDYFRAAPGAKGVKLDWTATWRNWIRKAEESASSRQGAHLRAVPALSADGERQLTNDQVDEILGPEAPPNPPDEVARQGVQAMRDWWEDASPAWREDRRQRALARLTARSV